jgi:biopolymer transport protein ExbB
MERAMVGTGQHQATVLSRNLRTLGVVANLSPMLGLFGTVVGMIRAFAVISKVGTGNPSLVAGGISEALITTAAGLLVGIPSLAAYHYFRSRGERYLFEIETIAFELLHILSLQMEGRGGLRPQAVPAPESAAEVEEA